ncbi:MAG: AraC family transcriptional regulator [Verrucomicrobiota bacterium]
MVSFLLHPLASAAKIVPMSMRRETIEMPEGQSFRIIRWSRSVRAVENLLADGRRRAVAGEGSRWHYHPEMELTLFSRGDGDRFVGDHIGAFGGGDLLLLGGMVPHYWHARGETAGLSLQWHFPAHHPLWELPETAGLAELFARAAGGLHISGATRDTLVEQIPRLAAAEGLLRFALLLELLHTVAAAPGGEVRPMASRTFVSPADRTYQDAMSRVLRYLVGNFREDIRLDEVLRIARLSRPTFARQFKRHTGRSLSDFLIELRLQAACRELAGNQRSVLEIALDCGFSQVSFFNRVFRRTMACSPSEYRSRAGLTDGGAAQIRD